MQESERLEKISNEKKSGDGNDWIAVVITLILLCAIAIESPKSNNQAPQNNPSPKTNTNVVNPDSLHVEQDIFIFDSLELIKKFKQNVK